MNNTAVFVFVTVRPLLHFRRMATITATFIFFQSPASVVAGGFCTSMSHLESSLPFIVLYTHSDTYMNMANICSEELKPTSTVQHLFNHLIALIIITCEC